MKDIKRSLFWILVFLIGIVLYNLCVFLLVSEYTNEVWCSYIFTMVAFVVQIIVCLIFNNTELTKRFLDLPLIYIGVIYFAIQFVAGVICMFAPIPFKLSIITQAVILAVFMVIAFFTVLGKDHIVKTELSIEKTTDFIRSLTMETEHIYESETNAGKKIELKKLFEAIRYSDPVSNTSEIQLIDKQIYIAFDSVRDLVSAGTVEDVTREVKRALDLIGKRNSLCKSSK